MSAHARLSTATPEQLCFQMVWGFKMSLRKPALLLLLPCAAYAQSINGVPSQSVTAVPASSMGSQSAAPTDLYVTETDYNGTTVTSSSPTTITGTTLTATSPTITPAATATTYWSELKLVMNPGITNSPTVTLYGNSGSGSDAVTIEPGTGCTSWH